MVKGIGGNMNILSSFRHLLGCVIKLYDLISSVKLR